MKVALVQMEVIQEQPENNLKRVIELSKQAVQKGANILLFPVPAL